MPVCYAKGCRNSSIHGVKMNFFPRDPKRRALWIRSCQKFDALTFNIPNDHSALCEYHFRANDWEKLRADGKKKLKLNALPTLFGDSVVQFVKKGQKKVPTKVFQWNNMVQTIPHTKGIQALSVPDHPYKTVLVNSSNNQVLKSEVTADKSEDSHMKERGEVPTTANKNTSILSNSSDMSSCTKNETSQDLKNSIKANDVISNGILPINDNSDTDSFIDKNFEPISDEEIKLNQEDYENFEPITYHEINSIEKDYLSIKESNLKTVLITEENNLNLALKRLNKSTSKTVGKCKRCDRLENLYLKSERVRALMKRNHKNTYAVQKRQIQSQENKIRIIESSNNGLHKVFNEDQIDFLRKDNKKVYKWSEQTIKKANHYLSTFGHKGYQLLLDDNWPLPTLRTLRQKQEKKKKIEKRKLIEVITIPDF